MTVEISVSARKEERDDTYGILHTGDTESSGFAVFDARLNGEIGEGG